MMSVQEKYRQYEQMPNGEWVITRYFLLNGKWKKSTEYGRLVRGRFVSDGPPIIEEVNAD